MATWVNLQAQAKKNAANVWDIQQEKVRREPLMWEQLSKAWDKLMNKLYWWTYAQAVEIWRKNQQLNNAKVEKTTWWYNYYLPWNQQWQVNSLVWTWNVAWVAPQINANLVQPTEKTTEQQTTEETPTQTAEQSNTTLQWWNTPAAQPTTQNRNNWTIQPSVSQPQIAVNPNAVYDANWNYLGSADIVNWQQQTQQITQIDNTANEQALINMQNDLAVQGGTVYGKISEWDGGNGINTIVDPYSVEQIAVQSRVANLKALQLMNSQDIAESLVDWYSPYWDQAMRDLMQYNLSKYQEVQQYMKEKQWQDAVNSIISDWKISATSNTTTATDAVNNWITNRANWVTSNPEESSQVTTNLMNTMASNQVANSATQEMLNINKDLAEYQYKLDHVMDEAKASFKWDVPQYLVDAKANNLTQKYQAQISKLESRYNAALDLYKTELSNAQRQAEMQLKYLDYQRDLTNDQRDRYFKSQSMLLDNIKRVDWVAYKIDPSTWTYKKLTDSTAYDTYNNSVQTAMKWYLSMFYDWYECWLQCEWFTDNFTQATAWIRMTWASSQWWTTAEEKLSYVNDFTPSVWSVVVAVWWAYDSTYWHTMLITWYDPETWIMDLMWSNTNWDRTIHTSRATMEDIQRNSVTSWIWNPYITAQWQSIAATGWYTQYWVTITPMTPIFNAMIEKWKDSDTIAKAEQAYTYLYEMVNDGSLQQLIESWDFGKIMAYMSKWNFGEKEDSWAKFAERLKTYIEKKAAKELMWGDESLAALNKLVQLVEVKLRKESWAAINSSERLTNFEMFLPSAWESTAYQWEKMKSRDALILRNLRSAWLSTIDDYIPVFSTQARQIRAY